jgi:hypothetical protein
MDLDFREFRCDDPKWKALPQDKIWLQYLVRYCSWRALTPLHNLVNLLESQCCFQETLIFYGSHVRQISTLVPNVLFFCIHTTDETKLWLWEKKKNCRVDKSQL